MKFTPELQREIERLDTQRAEYPYLGVGLGSRAAMLLVGGTGFGESTLIHQMEATGRARGLDIQEGGTRTTRERKPGDPAQYVTGSEGFTHLQAIDAIHRGEAVNWTQIAETKDIYMSTVKTFTSDITLLPTLPGSVDDIRKFGQRGEVRNADARVHVAYVVPDASEWWRAHKDRVGDPRLTSRLIEARDSLDFAQQTHDFPLIRVVNHFDREGYNKNLRKLAKGLLDVCQWPDMSYTDIIVDSSLREGFDQNVTQMGIILDDMISEAGAE
jgi:hypothetical protein